MNVTLLGNKVCTAIIKLKMQSLEWALIHYDWCPYKKERDTDIDTGRANVKVKAEIEVMCLQAKECPKLLTIIRN